MRWARGRRRFISTPQGQRPKRFISTPQGSSADSAPQEQHPSRAVPHKASALQGQGPKRAAPHKGSAPRGHRPTRVAPHKGSTPQGQRPTRTAPHEGSTPQRQPVPFFFQGFLRPISGFHEIENDAFHGHFTGYFLNFTTWCSSKQSSSRTLESRPDTGLRPTRAVLLCLIIACL